MASVIGKNEILLNSQRYKIAGPVRKTLVSIAAPRFTIGDTQRGADPRASILTQNDFRGGIGWNRGLDAGSIDRAWWTNCQTRFKGHVLLPRKVTTVTNQKSDGAGGFTALLTGEIKTVIEFQVTGQAASSNFVVFTDGNVYRYGENNDAYDVLSDAITLATPTSEAIVFNHTDNNSYLIFAQGDTGYSYTTNGTSVTNKTGTDPSGTDDRVEYFAIWHGTLWGIDIRGKLKNWASGPASAATLKAKLPLPDGYVTSLFIYRDAVGAPIIYAATKVGLWAYDETNNRWEETELRLPFHDAAGKGAIVWRDSVYYPAGNAIYKYQTGTNTAVVSLVGFDRDHGVPSTYQGQIVKLIGTHNDLLALVNSDIPVTYELVVGDGLNSGAPQGTVSGKGTSSVIGYNEQSWEVKWSAGDNTGITGGTVGSPYDEYRLWIAHGASLRWIKLSSDVINPDEITDFQYDTDTDGVLETPWFDGGDAAGNKLALALRTVTSGCSSSSPASTITITYALDFNEDTYYALSTITSNKTNETKFESGAGKEFASIKFKVELATDTTTNSPDLNLIELRWREKIPPKFGFSVSVDAAKSFAGNSPKQTMDNITTVINSEPLVEFTYKDSDSDRTYNVDLVSASGFEFTGIDERAQIQLQLVET